MKPYTKCLKKRFLNWKSKVQYKFGTPHIELTMHLSKKHSLQKGNQIEFKLIAKKYKLKIIIEVD
jgi:hypothetical protein